jgi:hypothetical protein
MKEVLFFLCCCCCCLNGRIESRPPLSLSLSPLQLIHCNAKAGFDAVFGTFDMLRRSRRRREWKEGRKEGREMGGERGWAGLRTRTASGLHVFAGCGGLYPVIVTREIILKCFFKYSPEAEFFFFLFFFGEVSPFGEILSQKLYIFYRKFLYFYF